ncbi:Nucleotide-diphospho-sugar transferases [Lasallia pustulata]|uniref:Ceramide glucosyltransferase n=1 Tax=Lasallia pustulata TaxID=136370 RepID=A0A1W5D435_9LECA|nr:Nucleotide-diphospho-sugar transferases [Lasallia pustulata]
MFFPSHDPPMWLEIVAVACLIWYVFILTVISIGFVQIRRNFSTVPPKAVSPTLPIASVPHVTILRPVKGLEPHLYDCLAATFHQTYPRSKLTIYLCISWRDDPAFPILQQLLADFPNYDAKILVEEEDPNLSGKDGREYNLGPNPKIRNMSRGYREAKGDIIWIIDCNVWISCGVAGRMVDGLCGLHPSRGGRKYKFVHQLPLVLDVPPSPHPTSPSSPPISSTSTASTSHLAGPLPFPQNLLSLAGGRLEEMFQSTTHAKFYTGINTCAVAPCIVGKSNMFRRSHLNSLTTTHPARSPGIDFFSDNICEDHLIGDLLWRTPVPASVLASAEREGRAPAVGAPPGTSNIRDVDTTWGNHFLLPGDLAIQPTSSLPLSQYLARRVRWLRVRKFTVTLATLIEPGVESLLCSSYGAFGLTSLPWCRARLHIPSSWPAFWLIDALGW